jgi:hypothetical protein
MMTPNLRTGDDGPYVAWVQGALSREIVEIVSAPYWSVDMPYVENWKRPRWRVEIVDHTPRNYACNGTPVCDVAALHPMNVATREMLRIRENSPPSPFVTPELP